MSKICLDCGDLRNSNETICKHCGSKNLSEEISGYNCTIGDYIEISKISSDGNFILQMLRLKNNDPIEYQLKMQQFKQTLPINHTVHTVIQLILLKCPVRAVSPAH